jgi:Poxvirus A32 protein
MSFEIIQNKQIKIPIPEFVCDGGYNDNLNDIPMLSHLNSYKTTALIGKPQSGKTSMLVGWLKSTKPKILRRCFHNVFIIMPKSSRESMKVNPFKNHDESKMFEELNYETLDHIYQRLLKDTAENKKSLLIMDDVGAAIKNKEVQQLFKLINYNRRHLKVKIIVLLQSYISVPREVRKLINNIVLWKPSLIEFENIMNECLEMKRDKAIELMKMVYTKPHDYLFLNIDNQKMYMDYNEIVLKKEDEDEENIEV